jgi:hypothetical protein
VEVVPPFVAEGSSAMVRLLERRLYRKVDAAAEAATDY